MSADGAKDNFVPVKMEGKAIPHGYRTFPNAMRPLNFFDSERRMRHFVKKEDQLFVKCLLDFMGQSEMYQRSGARLF